MIDTPNGSAQGPEPSFVVRRALDDDYGAFSRLFPGLEVDDPMPTPTTWASKMVPFSWVAAVGGDVIGYCYCQEYDDTGYVRQIVVASTARRRGVGRALLRGAAEHLRMAGKRFWRLNVKPDNHLARRLYERVGLMVAYPAVSLRFPWASLGGIAGGRATVGEVGPEQDVAAESAFGLPVGQLASARALNRIILHASLGWQDHMSGLAVFDPNFPGAFPFRVRDPEALEPLMAALRARARPSDTFVGIVVEDDAALASLLIRAGASIRDEILHMSGYVPGGEAI